MMRLPLGEADQQLRVVEDELRRHDEHGLRVTRPQRLNTFSRSVGVAGLADDEIEPGLPPPAPVRFQSFGVEGILRV